MPRVLNCASTWANHTSGSEGQKGGSFMLTASTSPSTDILLCVSHVVVTNVGDNIYLDTDTQYRATDSLTKWRTDTRYTTPRLDMHTIVF